jgi:hypothetical protein
MAKSAIMPPQFIWPPQVVEHFGSRGYQPEMEADNVAHTILTPDESKVSDETREILYSKLPIRFWVKTELTETCWMWCGAKHGNNGYGCFFWQGKNVTISRLVWWLLHGEIPVRMVVCHKCDNPLCFNPSHLFIGTMKDNLQDASRKGRCAMQTQPEKMREAIKNGPRPNYARGSRQGQSKLNETQVKVIKAALRSGAGMKALARMFQVGATTIQDIAGNRRWKHVTLRIEESETK